MLVNDNKKVENVCLDVSSLGRPNSIQGKRRVKIDALNENSLCEVEI